LKKRGGPLSVWAGLKSGITTEFDRAFVMNITDKRGAKGVIIMTGGIKNWIPQMGPGPVKSEDTRSAAARRRTAGPSKFLPGPL